MRLHLEWVARFHYGGAEAFPRVELSEVHLNDGECRVDGGGLPFRYENLHQRSAHGCIYALHCLSGLNFNQWLPLSDSITCTSLPSKDGSFIDPHTRLREFYLYFIRGHELSRCYKSCFAAATICSFCG